MINFYTIFIFLFNLDLEKKIIAIIEMGGVIHSPKPEYVPVQADSVEIIYEVADEKIESICEVVNEKIELPDSCPICLENLDDSTKVTECNHKFHDICLQNFLDKNKREETVLCPMCRHDITKMLGDRDPSDLYTGGERLLRRLNDIIEYNDFVYGSDIQSRSARISIPPPVIQYTDPFRRVRYSREPRVLIQSATAYEAARRAQLY